MPNPEDGIRSRCPSCEEMVVEGTEHVCTKGRYRKEFINPLEELGIFKRKEKK